MNENPKTPNDIIEACAKELAMDSAHIPAIKSVIRPHFENYAQSRLRQLREKEQLQQPNEDAQLLDWLQNDNNIHVRVHYDGVELFTKPYSTPTFSIREAIRQARKGKV